MIKNFRLVLLGKECIGKSSIIHRFVYNNFKDNHIATIGATYNTYYPEKYNRQVKLEIWDTAGQERYRSLVPMYYKNASIILIVFDITNKNSFEDAKYWINNISQNTFNNPFIALIGNKKDLEHKREVSIKDAKLCAEINNINYYELSALSGYGIHSSFEDIIDKSYKKFESTINENKYLIELVKNNEEKNKKCCF